MTQTIRSVPIPQRLLLFKWLMVLIPPLTVAVGHGLIGLKVDHGPVPTMLVTSVVTVPALVLAYVFVEMLFRVLRQLQAEAVARDQEVLTMNAVMQERERLSRELHDGAAQLVAHLLLRLDTIKDLMATNRNPAAIAEIERLHEVADELYTDIGESIAGVRADVTEHGLLCALRTYVDRLEELHGLLVHLHTDGVDGRLPSLVAFQVFRLVQEALTNVRKHAGAGEAIVTLSSEGTDRITVAVADDGRGYSPGKTMGTTRSLGLTGMRERVEGLGGSFVVESRPGAGTRVVATIPIGDARKEHGHASLATPLG